jgi:hypothetical protein
MHIRQVIFLIMFSLSVMAPAQNTYLRVKVRPVDAVTNYMITQARVSLLSLTDSAEVDTFKRFKIIGDVIEHYEYVYDNSHATLPFKCIVRIENKGYETVYYNLNISPLGRHSVRRS